MRPKIQSSHLLYSGFFDLKQDLLEKPDGTTHLFTSILLETSAVVILAQDREGRWILNREYRHPTEKELLGPPGGRLEKGEDPLKGAQRELLEETGYWSEEIAHIGSCHPFPGICDQKIHYFFAKNGIKKKRERARSIRIYPSRTLHK